MTDIQQQVLELYKTNQYIGQIATIVGIERHAVSRILIAGSDSYNPRTSGRHTYFYDEGYFNQIDTEDKAYYFGFLACDGWLKYERKLYPTAVGLELHEQDAVILERWHEILGEKSPTVTYRPKVNKAKIMLHSTRMCADLVAKGFGRDKTTSLGDITPHVPPELFRHFLRGVLDGDGGWRVEPYRLRFSLRGTDAFLLAIKNTLPVEAIIAGRGKWKSLVTTKHGEAVRLGEILYADTDLFLNRKFDKYLSGLERRRSSNNSEYQRKP